MHLILIVLFLFITVCMIIRGCTPDSSESKDPSSLLPDSPNINVLPTGPDVPHVVSTATVGITGSIYVENALLTSALTDTGSYDFSKNFSTIKHSYGAYDFMIAHLETTLGGTTAGEYSGNERFNSPDEIITAAKAAGIDMLLTSNNHSYDTGHDGLIRTQEIIRQSGLAYTGTRLNSEAPTYLLQDVNGVKLGMICYTNESGDTAAGDMTIDNLTVAKEDADLINTFNYRKMDQFYEEVKQAKEAMDSAGADYILFFIHWGNEFDLTPSNTQKKIAQNLCELGIDFIIGSHPHTVQPMALLTAESGSKTYCLYSAGNALSSQRRKDMNLAPNGHTEDGIILGIKFERWSDGTTKIVNLNATPLWTDMAVTGDAAVYTVLPVDVSYNFYPALGTFADSVNSVVDPNRPSEDMAAYAPSDLNQINASYTRTMDTVLTGLNECRQALGLNPVSNISGN